MMAMTHMPMMSNVSTASGKGGGTTGGQSAQSGDVGFADALTSAKSSDSSSSSSQAKSQKTPTTAAGLLAMLLAALQPQNSAVLQTAAKADDTAVDDTQAASADSGKNGGKTTSGTGSKGLDLQQLLALLSGGTANGSAGLQNRGDAARDCGDSSGETADARLSALGQLLQNGASGASLNDRLSTLLGLSTKEQSALQNIPTDDKANLLKLLTGQKDVPDAFVQRLQAALAKADPQLLKQLQSRPLTITVGAESQGQAHASTSTSAPAASFAADAQAASAPRATLSQTVSDETAHTAKSAVAAARQSAGAATARPSVPTGSADSSGHTGQDAKTDQDLLQGGLSELLGKGSAKATSGHSADTSGFSLAGLGGHHGSVSPLHTQGEGQVQTPTATPVPEQQIVDQVVKGVGDAKTRESTSITVKMHPEELGQVKLELTVGKDGLKAHLHTQTQQVQDVLEKHLPKLRHALEQQGLRLDEVRVSVDSGGSGGQSSFAQYQQQQQGHPSPFQTMPRWSGMRTMPAMAAASPAAVSGGTAQSGLSVRI